MAIKRVSESDVKSRLAVLKGVLESHQTKPLFSGSHCHVADVWAVDGATGMFWEFRCGPHKKPVFLSENWLRFVRHKGLVVGDRLVLDDERNFRGTRFVLRAQRLLSSHGQRWVDL